MTKKRNEIITDVIFYLLFVSFIFVGFVFVSLLIYEDRKDQQTKIVKVNTHNKSYTCLKSYGEPYIDVETSKSISFYGTFQVEGCIPCQ